VALPELLFVALAPVLLLALARRGAWGAMPRTGFVLVGVLIAGLGPSVLLAGDRRRALAQLAVLIYVALIHQAALAVLTLGLWRAAMRSLVAGAAVACLMGLGATFGAWLGGDPGQLAVRYPWMPVARPLGPTESPTMLAMIALGGGAAALTLRRERALPGWPAVALAGMFVLTLLLSQSRVVLAAAAGAGVAWAWSSRAARSPGSRALRRTPGLVVAGAAVGVLLLSLWFRVVPLRTASPFIDTGTGPYRVCNEIAWSMFRAHPLAGVGLENFHRAWPEH
jgi:hypothetical protein